MHDLADDLRHAVRLLRRSPVFSAIVVATLALGIGGNAAIFSLLDQVLLRVLAVEDPRRLVLLDGEGTFRGRGYRVTERPFPMSHPMWVDLRDHESMAGVSARFPTSVNLGTGQSTERVIADLVGRNYFEVLGVEPALGRLFSSADDETRGAHPAIVLSHRFWNRRFGADPEVVGRELRVNGHPMTVIGVSAAGFQGIQRGFPADVMLPLSMEAQAMPGWNGLGDRKAIWLHVFGRLASGVDATTAAAALNVRYHQVLAHDVELYPEADVDFRREFTAKSLTLLPGWRGVPELQSRIGTPLMVLMGMVGLVLLIACANVANLLLARASYRQKEIALRLTLGATRRRLVRQLAIESLVLAALGGAAGLLVASWAGSVVLRTVPIEGLGESLSTDPDRRVVFFTLALSTLTGLLAGLVPALQATRSALAPTLKGESGTLTAAQGPQRLRRALVVAQVALSMLLLVGSGLFVRSLRNLRALDPGFVGDRLIAFSVEPSLSGYDDEGAKRRLYERVRDEVAALPGVSDVSYMQQPIMSSSHWRGTMLVDGYEPTPDEEMNMDLNAVGPGIFSTLGVRVVAGRGFEARDTADAPKVAVVSESFARRFYGNEAPLGRRIGFRAHGDPRELEIVGVVGDGRILALQEDVPELVYVPMNQAPVDAPGATFYVRSELPVASVASAVRETMRRVDAGLPVYDLHAMRQQIDDSLYVERLVAALSAAFGALATLLAAIGLYGVMSYAISRRTREIGVRVALGADRARILRMVLGEVALLAGLGMAIGLPGGLGLGRAVESQLHGLTAVDPASFAVAIFTLAASAFLAGLVPASRAARLHPALALRTE